MKNLIITITLTLVSLTAMGNNNPIEWNNNGIHAQLTVKKGDRVSISEKSNVYKYVKFGTIQHICNAKYVKINGYFVKVSDIETINVYNTQNSKK